MNIFRNPVGSKVSRSLMWMSSWCGRCYRLNHQLYQTQSNIFFLIYKQIINTRQSSHMHVWVRVRVCTVSCSMMLAFFEFLDLYILLLVCIMC